jgi:hypothetical protein
MAFLGFSDTVEPGYNKQTAPYYYIDSRLDIIYMNMESSPNCYWPDQLFYQSAPHCHMNQNF